MAPATMWVESADRRDACNISQREVVFNTLKDVVLADRFDGELWRHGLRQWHQFGKQQLRRRVSSRLANLSVDVDNNLDGDYNVIVAPDCDAISSANWPPYCQFINSIPGPPSASASDPRDCINYTGAGCLPSNTARPQAEALFDAGYYFGAGRPGEVDSAYRRSQTTCRSARQTARAI